MTNPPVPYVVEPPLSAVLHRVSLFARYAVLAIMGLILFMYFAGALPWAGLGIFVLGTASAVSVMFSQYRLEWVSLLPLTGLCVVTAILLMGISTGVVIMLLIVASLSMIERYFHLSHVARKLRKLPKS